MLDTNICTRSMYSIDSVDRITFLVRKCLQDVGYEYMHPIDVFNGITLVSCKSLQDVGYEYMHHKSSDFVDISGFSCGNTFFIFKNSFANFIFKIIKKVLQKVMH